MKPRFTKNNKRMYTQKERKAIVRMYKQWYKETDSRVRHISDFIEFYQRTTKEALNLNTFRNWLRNNRVILRANHSRKLYTPEDREMISTKCVKFLEENNLEMTNGSITLFCRAYEEETGETLKNPTVWGWINGVGETPPVISTEQRKRIVSLARRPLVVGSVLVREYEGEKHIVEVTNNGFKYRNNMYTSLSAVTRHITSNNQRNGFAFFKRSITETPTSTVNVTDTPHRGVIFCSSCYYHAEADVEEEDVCKASLASTPSGNISFVRKPSFSERKIFCQHINTSGNCGMFEAKMKKDE